MTTTDERRDVLRWLDELAWSDADAAGFAALDTRSETTSRTRSFEEQWPESDIVDAWFEAAFRSVALACVKEAGPRLEARHAQTLATQSMRGFGWGNSEHRDPVRAKAGLLAALVGDFDLVVRALGSGPLASRVSTARVPATLGALVRHVATTARHHLGEGASAVALRAYAASETCEPAIFWALARLAIEHAGGHPTSEVRARALALLDPSAEKLPATAQRTAPTDDPRVSIFERYMLVLTDPEARAGLEDAATYVRTLTPRRAWESHSASFVARALMFGFDDLLEGVLPILLALDPRAASYTPSPGLLLRAMLGHPIDGWETLLREDLRKFHKAKAISTLRRYRWSTEAAAVALAAGDTKLVKLLVGERKGAFRPKLRLGDEPRVVFAYFAQALEQREGGRAAGSAAERKVEREDLEPAWQDLVASRVPDESDRARTGGAFGWVGLLCLAFTRLVRFGGHAPTEVAPLLRAELRGR